MNLKPVTLKGSSVRLEPLSLSHLDALCDVGLDPDLWKITVTLIRNREEMKAYIEEALDWQAKGTALPFAIVEKASNKVVGSTRFANVDPKNRRLEIGWTWLNPRWQRTAINTEAKFLLLGHAFEKLECIRVELKTDSINERSRNAILRIGAKEEGILRNHMITHSGRIRHTVYFSITDAEWPDVKRNLLERLQGS